MPRRPRNGSAKPNASGRKRKTSGKQSAGKLYSFTIDASTGRVVNVEALDANGARHEISDEEKVTLARKRSERIEQALEEAFQAGIDCVLGAEEERDEAESQQDREIRRVLLSPLIARSPAKRLLDRQVLDRAILDTLFQHSIDLESNQARTSPPKTSPADVGRSPTAGV
jgi:hypothetical protein